MTRLLALALLFTCLPAHAAERRAHLYREELPSAPGGTSLRIVSLAPVLTETLFALGVGERVVGVTRYCDRPAEARAKARVGGFIDPQLERILELKPDLVVAMPSMGQREVLDHLRSRGVGVLIAFGDTVAEVEDMIASLGRVTGTQARAAQLLEAHRAGLRLASTFANPSYQPRVAVVFQTNPLVVAGPGTFPAEAVSLSGGVPAAPAGSPPWPTWSYEALLAADPDLVVVADGPRAADELRARLGPLARGAQRLRVISADGPILSRPGPTLHEDVQTLARLLAGAKGPSSRPAASP
jgi:iron complex transport system substrate-binding protein